MKNMKKHEKTRKTIFQKISSKKFKIIFFFVVVFQKRFFSILSTIYLVLKRTHIFFKLFDVDTFQKGRKSIKKYVFSMEIDDYNAKIIKTHQKSSKIIFF